MNTVMHLTVAETMPDPKDILRGQNFPEGTEPSPRVWGLLMTALQLYAELASPQGVFREIDSQDFARVYAGQGKDVIESPLPQIFPLAEGLALFAATNGERVSAYVQELFAAGELPLAVMLDSVASDATDRLSYSLGTSYLAALVGAGRASEQTTILPYSPGYCGWDVSGQAQLFEYLRPEQVGITLNDSFLMQPLKSVSGVLVAGPARIHCFRPVFPCCEGCQARPCLGRIASVLARNQAETGRSLDHGDSGGHCGECSGG